MHCILYKFSQQRDSKKFPVFPGGISNSRRLPVFRGVIDTLHIQSVKQLMAEENYTTRYNFSESGNHTSFIHEVWSVQMDKWAESEAVTPWRCQINHFDKVTIRLQLSLKPLQQVMTVSQHVYRQTVNSHGTSLTVSLSKVNTIQYSFIMS